MGGKTSVEKLLRYQEEGGCRGRGRGGYRRSFSLDFRAISNVCFDRAENN